MLPTRASEALRGVFRMVENPKSAAYFIAVAAVVAVADRMLSRRWVGRRRRTSVDRRCPGAVRGDASWRTKNPFSTGR